MFCRPIILFIFENLHVAAAKEITEEMLKEIRSTSITYENDNIHITMTFGLTQGGVGTNTTELIQKADALLYKGKNNGRNQIVIEEKEQDSKGE